jgi:hypothetical protein
VNLETDCVFNDGLYNIVNDQFERIVVRLGAGHDSFESTFEPNKYIAFKSIPKDYSELYVRLFMLPNARTRKIFEASEGIAPYQIPKQLIAYYSWIPGGFCI